MRFRLSIFSVLAIFFIFGLGCLRQPPIVNPMSEKVSFITSDGVEIAGLLCRGQGQKFAVLLHMMPATKESWSVWQEKLAAAGYTSLAIDERGHGESVMGGRLDYKKFSEAEQQAKIHDVEAAFEYLKKAGAAEENTVVVGASIGANLAIEFLQEHPSMKFAVALSPGLNYRGVLTEPYISSLNEGQKVILVASDDDEESYEAVKRLNEIEPEQTVLIEQSGLGHGTRMTDASPELIDEVIKLLP